SMIAKEVGYIGFGSLPVLSNSLFGTWFILSQYDPLDHLAMNMPKGFSEGFAARLNNASKMMLETAIKGGDYWPNSYMHRVGMAYENLCHQWSYARPKSLLRRPRLRSQIGPICATRSPVAGKALCVAFGLAFYLTLSPVRWVTDGEIANMDPRTVLLILQDSPDLVPRVV